MRKSTLFRALAAVVVMACAALAPIDAGTAAAAPSDGAGIRVPLTSNMRACDYTRLMVKPFWGTMHAGQGEAVIRRNGNTVTADIQFVNTRRPGTHYDVGLIQVPRASSASCGPGSPGTVYAPMDVDPAGRAAVTLQDTIQSGTTGVWVQMLVPSPHSQDPVEYYTSSFLAQV